METTWGGAGVGAGADPWLPPWTFWTIVPGDRVKDLPQNNPRSLAAPLGSGSFRFCLCFSEFAKPQAFVLVFGAGGWRGVRRGGLKPDGCNPCLSRGGTGRPLGAPGSVAQRGLCPGLCR